MAIQQNPMLGHIFDRRGQHIAFNSASSMSQLLGAHAMVHADHVLLDDRPLIQITRHKMGGGTDNLHPAIVCLVVWLGSLEGGQEAMVDVDDLARHGFAERR